jgi:hypothetical protein
MVAAAIAARGGSGSGGSQTVVNNYYSGRRGDIMDGKCSSNGAQCIVAKNGADCAKKGDTCDSSIINDPQPYDSASQNQAYSAGGSGDINGLDAAVNAALKAKYNARQAETGAARAELAAANQLRSAAMALADSISSGCGRSDGVILSDHMERPYSKDSIKSMDDYEYNSVFANENDRSITKEQRDKLMSQYPMDWTTQPPSSDQFSRGLNKFRDASGNVPGKLEQSAMKKMYGSVSGNDMMPQDTCDGLQMEREILQTYKPKDPQSLTTYDAADAHELIKKLYDAKGKEADYVQSGTNQFTIIGTRPKNQPVVWEDEVDTSSSGYDANGSTMVVPLFQKPEGRGLDPFFTVDKSGKTRDSRFDYTSWTPGLERMFAPNMPQEKWY